MRRFGHLLPTAVLATYASAAVPTEAPLGIHIHSDKAMFQVLISPGKVGSDDVVLQLMNGDGTLLSAKAATLVLSSPEGGSEQVARKAELGADGYWHIENVPMPVPFHGCRAIISIAPFQIAMRSPADPCRALAVICCNG